MGLKEELAVSASEYTTRAGAGVAVFGGLTANEIAAFGGLLVAVLGFAYNVWRGQQSLRIMRENKDADRKERE